MSFKEYVSELAKKVEAKEASKAFSKSCLAEMTQNLLNDPEAVLTTVVRDGDKYSTVSTKPAEEFRNGVIVALLKDAGVDAAEAEKAAANFKFNNKHAKAFVCLIDALLKSYLETGKTYALPRTRENETSMSMAISKLPEKVTDRKVPVRNAEGKMVGMETTGEVTVTKERYGLKAMNKVPANLKEVKKK